MLLTNLTPVNMLFIKIDYSARNRNRKLRIKIEIVIEVTKKVKKSTEALDVDLNTFILFEVCSF